MKITAYNKDYDLKPKTLAVAKQIQAVEQSDNVISAYENEFKVLILALGDAAVAEIFDTTDINDVDLTEMVKIYNKVIAEYDRPEIEASKREIDDLMNSETMAKIDKLAKQAQVISGLAKTLK